MAAAERAEPAEVPVLMTGFEPFGDYAVNPSWEVGMSPHCHHLHHCQTQPPTLIPRRPRPVGCSS